MASGINVEKVNALKVELLNYIEQLNVLYNRLNDCSTTIQANMDGFNKAQIVNKLNSIIEQMPKATTNINTYISDLGKVVKSYQEQDEEEASTVVNNISKVDALGE